MKKKCLLLLNSYEGNDFYIYGLKDLSHRNDFILVISDDFRAIELQDIDFVLCINYPKIVPKRYIDMVRNGIYVFHGSDLPKGRGWAPIYNSIANKERVYTLTMLKINENVDDGEVIAKARFKKRNGENADSLRKVDDLMTLWLIGDVIDDLIHYTIRGARQRGKVSYYKKRKPTDSEIKLSDTIENIHDHCLALADGYPAFYFYKNKKFILRISPESIDDIKEKDIRIKLFYTKHGRID